MNVPTDSKAVPQRKGRLRGRPIALLLLLHSLLVIPLAFSPSTSESCPPPQDFEADQPDPWALPGECADIAWFGGGLGVLVAAEMIVVATIARVPWGKQVLGVMLAAPLAALTARSALLSVSAAGPIGAFELVTRGWTTAGLIALIGTEILRVEPPGRSPSPHSPSG